MSFDFCCVDGFSELKFDLKVKVRVKVVEVYVIVSPTSPKFVVIIFVLFNRVKPQIADTMI